MKSHQILSLAILAALCPIAGQAQAVPGQKSSVTISLKLTESQGGYYITDAKADADEDKFIEYSAVVNPRGFDADEADANYFAIKTTTKYLLPATEQFPTSAKQTYSVKRKTTKYGNTQFLSEMAARGVIPNPGNDIKKAIAGYKLVAVVANSGSSLYYFAEKKGVAPIYVGRVASLEETSAAHDFLVQSQTSSVNSMTYSGSTTSTQKYKAAGNTYEADGNEVVKSSIKQDIQNLGEMLIRRSPVSTIEGEGLASINLTVSSNNDVQTVKFTRLNGTYTGAAEDANNEIIAQGTIKVGASKSVADISPYLDALPLALLDN